MTNEHEIDGFDALHTEPPPLEPPRRPRRRGRAALLMVAAAALVAVAAIGLGAGRRAPTSAGSVPLSAGPAGDTVAAPGAWPAVGQSAPDGQYTTLGGESLNVSALRGQPTMVWFLAAGCSSCAASVPKVADNLRQLSADGVKVLVVDLYGDMDPGAKGLSELADFARQTAGPALSNPAWTWGVASQTLSSAYDPAGTPDVYFLLDAGGRVRYQDSVPVSTMGSLLAHARTLSPPGQPLR